jgi:hypothetical protein
MKSLVIGNGESRSWFDPSKNNIGLDEVKTWGCNAIYRDGIVDNLVAVDYGIQQEIVKSKYPLENKCWFTNWSTVPDFVADTMFMGYKIPDSFIHYSGDKTDKCVISGKDPATLQEKIDTAMHMNPDLDMEDLRMKMEKDSGVWITYVTGNERICPVGDYLRSWSAGNAALHLACDPPMHETLGRFPIKSDEVYMIGYDLSTYEKPLNNMYKGTDNYLPANAKGFSSVNWGMQLKRVFTDFPDTTFYWVDATEEGKTLADAFHLKNIIYITKDELCEELKIT